MEPWTRRRFIKSTGLGVAAAPAVGLLNNRGKAAPNSRLRHAIIGTGGMGTVHTGLFGNDLGADVEVVAVCDVDPKRRKKAASVPKSSQVKEYEDYRELLDQKDVDSVSIVTQDQWHAPIAIAALLAGKHVYVEKTCTHNFREGQVLIKAARKSGKCLQHGTQHRSTPDIRAAIGRVHDGQLGKVRLAKALNHQMRGPIGRALETEPPPGVNYDLWTGPSPLRPFTKNRFHYNWHWFWDYGTGDIGNDGIHQLDAARWGLGVKSPKSISASGGQLFYDDDHETPDTQVITYEFDDAYIVYDMRLWQDYQPERHNNGTIFFGDNGTVEIGRRGCELWMKETGEKKTIGSSWDVNANMRNFVDAAKIGDPSKCLAPVEEAVLSANLVHLGNVATRVGRKLAFDADKGEIVGDAEANALLGREYRKGYELPQV
jgi:predicted dehydrogenase